VGVYAGGYEAKGKGKEDLCWARVHIYLRYDIF